MLLVNTAPTIAITEIVRLLRAIWKNGIKPGMAAKLPTVIGHGSQLGGRTNAFNGGVTLVIIIHAMGIIMSSPTIIRPISKKARAGFRFRVERLSNVLKALVIGEHPSSRKPELNHAQRRNHYEHHDRYG